MRPGPPAVCTGEVFHARTRPTEHRFRRSVRYVWLDPDAPEAVCRHHRLWSASGPAPVRFRIEDYGDGSNRSLGKQVRGLAAEATGRYPSGPVRMLTQFRRWGWLFNPITVYLLWDSDPDVPSHAVLEVTNTPWKERHSYATKLHAGPGDSAVQFQAEFGKVLHVSPFLDEDFVYRMEIDNSAGDYSPFRMGLDVRPSSDASPILRTGLTLSRQPVERRVLSRELFSSLAPTHLVSAGIHVEAARLWHKGVPFVSHPEKRSPSP